MKSFFFLIFVFALAAHVVQCAPGHPVVLIHGMIGSVLEAKIDIPAWVELPNIFCPRKWDDWRRIWIDGFQMELPMQDCYFAFMEMKVENGTFVSRIPGVQIRIPRHLEGSTFPLDSLDPNLGCITHEYHEMIEAFTNIGYADGTSIFGLSYDWRLLPTTDSNWIQHAKRLVEKAFDFNKTPVVLAVHSMGGPVSRHFLNQMTPEWRKQYIHHWVTIASPWIGAPATVKAIGDGYNFGLPIFECRFRNVARNSPGGYCLMPHPQFYGDAVLASTPTKQYTAKNYQELFKDLGMDVPQSNYFLKQGLSIYENFEFPTGVKMTCIYSKGLDTINKINYTSNFRVDYLDYTTGDGIVPELSARKMCEMWQQQHSDSVSIVVLSGVGHIPIVRDDQVIQKVLKIASF